MVRAEAVQRGDVVLVSLNPTRGSEIRKNRIIIRLYLTDNQHHNLPHVRAKYAEFEASICVEDSEVLAGKLPRKQLRLVQAWIELRRDELLADWELTVSGEAPIRLILCECRHELGCDIRQAFERLPHLRRD